MMVDPMVEPCTIEETGATSETPNEETRRAAVEAEAKELGLIEDDSPRFRYADAAIAFLRSP